jgi:hypothetical protein
VVKHLRAVSNADVAAVVGDVAVSGPMLTATVSTHQGPAGPAAHYQRALAVRGDTIVEVSLAVSDLAASDAAGGAAGSGDDAVRAAQAMLNKVRAGS